MTEKSKRPRESGLDPYRLARRFAEKLQVRYWRDEFWVWQPTQYRYRRVTEQDLKARVATLLKREIDARSLTQGDFAAHVTVARVNNILAALKGHVLVEGSVEMPTWLKGSGPDAGSRTASCRWTRRSATSARPPFIRTPRSGSTIRFFRSRLT